MVKDAIKKAIVSVGFGDIRFVNNLHRLIRIVTPNEVIVHWDGICPPALVPVSPYSFKVDAIELVHSMGAEIILWCDSSIVPIKPLDELWDLIESQGYWFSKNYGYTNGEWCCDAALPILGTTREESFKVPQIIATSFGLNLRQPIAQEWFSRWRDLAFRGAFNGPHDGGSTDPRVVGHRHDQTAGAHICHQLGMTLTTPPDWIAEGGQPINDNTLMVIERF